MRVIHNPPANKERPQNVIIPPGPPSKLEGKLEGYMAGFRHGVALKELEDQCAAQLKKIEELQTALDEDE